MNARTCYSLDQLSEYACCSCSEEHSQQIEGHLEQCQVCQEQLAKIIDSGIAPSFMQLGRALTVVRESSGANESSRADKAERIAVESTDPTRALRSMPETIGQYRITGYIGGGGMGSVYSAWDELLKRPVALKLLRRHDERNSRALRMLQEAAALGRLSHPNIVSIYEVLSHERQPVLSMELVEGQNLAKWLDGRRVNAKAAAELVLKLASALHHAHSKGVVHRDLKPANVMLEVSTNQSSTLEDLSDLVPKIADFGLAKLVGENMMTNTGDMLGTPAYMAPEQATGNSHASGAAVDIYALGVILYELLTGRPPFMSDNLMHTLNLVQHAIPTSPRVINSTVPKDLDTVCLKCLEKNAADRYSSAAELADDIGNFLECRPVSARPLSPLTKCWRWAGRHRTLAASLATSAALLVAIAVGSFIVASRESKLRWELERKTQENESARIEGLVQRLVSAEPNHLPAITKELDANPELAAVYLSPLLSTEPSTAEEKRARLHARIASVTRNPSLVESLTEELLSCHVAYITPIREQLRPSSAICVDKFRTLLRNEQAEAHHRFRAAIALAAMVEASAAFWTEADFQLIVEQLVGSNAEHQPLLRDALRPVGHRLVAQLENKFSDLQLNELKKLGVANALADFSSANKSKLSRLLALADPEQFNVLYPLVADQLTPAAREEIAQIVAASPPETMDHAQRIEFGQRRANAAVTLLRLGEHEMVLPIFDIVDDPEALTQFIFRCRPRGVRALELLNLLEAALHKHSEPKERARLGTTRYALLLALGEFRLAEIPESRREPLLRQLADWYRDDPSSGVHGATRWLLRTWGQEKTAQKIDNVPVKYAPDCEWFNQVITTTPTPKDNAEAEEPQSFSYTFIVYPAGTYTVGRRIRQQVTITAPFAILDREITCEELIAFAPRKFSQLKRHVVNPNDAGTAIVWSESIAFCRWLGMRSGMEEDEQAYLSPELLNAHKSSAGTNVESRLPDNWPIDIERPGFRLPTSTEWEIANRAGMRTDYSFGSEIALLDQFGWHAKNGGNQIHQPRELRPSLRGLFDIHGNACEWTNDWLSTEPLANSVNPLGPKSGTHRTLRGGSYDNLAEVCKSSRLISGSPTTRSQFNGLRPAVTLKSK